MILKIFTKCLPGGNYVPTAYDYKVSVTEANRFLFTEEGSKIQIMATNYGDKESGSSFEMVMDTLTHGYELKNDAGVVIERYVSALTDEQLSKK